MNEHIERQAARWLVELDSQRRSFETWLNERPEHRAAFEDMEKAWTALDDLRVFFIPGGPKLPPYPSRYSQTISRISAAPSRWRARIERIRCRWREWRIK